LVVGLKLLWWNNSDEMLDCCRLDCCDMGCHLGRLWRATD
jgi:hypothetical protein